MEIKATTEGLFTEKQIKYVNSVEDKYLRDHLLHQVRLRDIMEEDRDAFEKQSNYKNSVEHAIKIIQNALKTDEGYKIGWQANIAMAFKDEFWQSCTTHQHLDLMDEETLHKIANTAADNFLNLLCKDGNKEN